MGFCGYIMYRMMNMVYIMAYGNDLYIMYINYMCEKMVMQSRGMGISWKLASWNSISNKITNILSKGVSGDGCLTIRKWLSFR